MQESLINTVEEKGIELDNQIHNDMLAIMQEKSEEIESFPNDSFRQLFWKQQLEAAIKNNPKQMKWHPLMIRWCLSVRLKSMESHYGQNSDFCVYSYLYVYKRFLILYVVL